MSIYKASGRYVCEVTENLESLIIGLPRGAYELTNSAGARIHLFTIR